MSRSPSDAAEPFRLYGGRPCLDLTATVAMRPTRPAELLRAPADLARWCVAAGLAEQPPRVSGQELAQSRTLREALHRLLTSHTTGTAPGPGDLAIVNDWAGRPPPREWLQPGSEGLRCRRDPITGGTLLAEIARDAVRLLGGPLAERIRVCAGADCALLFLDTSRAGRRRWCSMDICGARAKMAAYRARRSPAPEPAGTDGQPSAGAVVSQGTPGPPIQESTVGTPTKSSSSPPPHRHAAHRQAAS